MLRPSKEADERALPEGDGPDGTHLVAAVAADAFSIVEAYGPVGMFQGPRGANGLASPAADAERGDVDRSGGQGPFPEAGEGEPGQEPQAARGGDVGSRESVGRGEIPGERAPVRAALREPIR